MGRGWYCFLPEGCKPNSLIRFPIISLYFFVIFAFPFDLVFGTSLGFYIVHSLFSIFERKTILLVHRFVICKLKEIAILKKEIGKAILKNISVFRSLNAETCVSECSPSVSITELYTSE